MAVAHLAHSWRVDSPPESVFAHLTEPQHYIGLSPLVVEVRDVRRGTDEHGEQVTDYVAVERFRFLKVLRWDNLIRVRMRVVEPGRALRQSVVSPGGVRLEWTVRLTPEEDGATVDDRLEMTMAAPMRGFVTRQARGVQLHRAAELTRRMARHG
ncbi:SRPBCC family protein [Catellatospora sichuanensis]|uniref:SRPBCC family protein n=1 Tax=Catellatospora sichuanensis TaxID=1969805 RepID=UPI001183C4A8|nr:SRPBCC family protein [Catellatospora sichuanensis]